MSSLPPESDTIHDVAVIGSGFAGSLLAHGLDSLGLRIAVIERGAHPRFAIGESSTPLADLSLRRIAARANLPWLEPLSRFGTWRAHRPELLCGRKRGFSYLFHTPAGPARASGPARMLHVAASSSDRDSDTQWYRPDLDRFLVEQFAGTPIRYADQTRVVTLHRDPDRNLWRLHLQRAGTRWQLHARFLIDATGSPAFSQDFLRVTHSATGFSTHSRAIYSHLQGLPRWRGRLRREWLGEALSTSGMQDDPMHADPFPYDPDFSALHHVLGEGWMWMLRFENDRVSVGLVLEGESGASGGSTAPARPQEELETVLRAYPELWNDLRRTPHATRPDGPDPLGWMATGRLQRMADSMHGQGWLMAPHTAGFVDPLHSTGLAHTLHGIERILDLFDPAQSMDGRLPDPHSAEFRARQERLETDLRLEFAHIDRLVAAAYATRHDPEAFRTAAMLYFVNTIHAEQARLATPTGHAPGPIPPFLSAGNAPLAKLTRELTDRILAARRFDADSLRDWVEAIRPHDPVGLFEPYPGLNPEPQSEPQSEPEPQPDHAPGPKPDLDPESLSALEPTGSHPPRGTFWRPKRIITHSAVSLD